ncbi:PAS domain S-box protein [Flavobacterium sp. GSP6]|uniref:sensor histidine kinase n=1 Tax=Flavobacterium sp. GSP6 TaxID=2497488 RepID=UPI000F87A22A|nr:PAS domain S-box protein [Flavobacterium sp. GSP6]RTZ03676.1 PAS domain S-box protein [Flavobacterium sp. GSP6]
MPVFDKKKISELFENRTIQEEFNTVLLFASEVCEMPLAFISLTDSISPIIVTKIGFDYIPISPTIIALNENTIQQNKIKIISDINKDIDAPPENLNLIAFFAGFPICFNENLVIGTLCIMDTSPRELSVMQLKHLKYTVLQIQSLLKLHIENQSLQKTIKEQDTQFQLFIDNSKEITYELNLEGIITYASDNWTKYLGYENKDILDKSNTFFLHPDDLENCKTYLSEAIETGKNEGEFTYRILHQEGYYVWHSTRLKLSQKNGLPIFIGNCRDITEYIEIQQKLVLQKEFYEKILDRLPTDVAVFDSSHTYTYLNPAAIKKEELRKFIIGKNDFEYAKHTGRDDAFAKTRRIHFLEAIESRNTIEWEDTIEHLDGTKTYHTRKLTPVFHEDETLEMMIGFGVDITESKKTQQEIIKSRQLTKSIIYNIAVGIIVQGPDSEILENNKAACEMLGLTEDQLLGKTSYDEHWKTIHLDGTLFKVEDHAVPQAIQTLKPINNVIMGVYNPTLKNLVWLLVDAVPVLGKHNELLFVICSFIDISAQKKAEDDLKESNERFSYFSKATFDAIWDWDLTTDKIYVGDGFKTLFGYTFKKNVLAASLLNNFLHPDEKKAVFESLDVAVKSQNNVWSHEYRYKKTDTSYGFVNDKAIIIRNNEGKAIRMIGAMQEITKEKILKDELQQSQEQFKDAFEYSAAGMALIDIDDNFVEVNEKLCEILGYSKKEFASLTSQEITYPKDLKNDFILKEQLNSGKISNFNLEKRFIHKNKSVIWMYISASIIKSSRNKTKRHIFQMINITDRKRIEKQNKILSEENNRIKTIQLNKAKNLYRLLADNTVDLVCLHNTDTSFKYVSPSIEKLLGYTPQSLIGKFPVDYAHPDDIEELQSHIIGFLTEMEDIAIQIRFRNISGDYIWFEIKANLVKENGVTISFHSSNREITTQKEAEEKIEKALLKERDLNDLRTNLVSTISHEFRTPMTTIRTSAELISLYLEHEKIENAPRLQKRIDCIIEEIDRIVQLMNAVLTISKEDSGKTNFDPTEFDLKQICLDVIEISYPDQLIGRKVQTSIKGDNFRVMADQKLMEYTIFNLLNNAFKYSEGFGDIELNLCVIEKTICLEIIDLGIGIPAEDQPKLFNTFFRASNTDGIQGTGLGLYIVKTFTEKNSGTIQLESKLGKGTKVTLEFPVHN